MTAEINNTLKTLGGRLTVVYPDLKNYIQEVSGRCALIKFDGSCEEFSSYVVNPELKCQSCSIAAKDHIIFKGFADEVLNKGVRPYKLKGDIRKKTKPFSLPPKVQTRITSNLGHEFNLEHINGGDYQVKVRVP